ncbi:MAG: ABC transporter permease [Planctomycetaceae bacterium]|nr:MAG: ABC transporter permease [Planctomycetaceae bacterium]
MLAGPIFTREVLTSPRSTRHFVLRAGYVFALFVLMYTAGQATFGWRQATGVGELARFGSLLFQLFSLIQLALVMFFAPLFAASRVAQEKDRQTLVLLLMTDLRNFELVAGKLGASLLAVAVLLAASAPVFALVYLLGGSSLEQIGWSLMLCAATGLACGSWGSMVAFWREKTFQTLAISVLGMVLFIGVIEAGVAVLGIDSGLGRLLSYCDPFRGMALILDPLAADSGVGVARLPAWPYVASMVALATLFNAVAVARLRVWNPSRTFLGQVKPAETTAQAVAAPAPSRAIWSNPVIWREICTRAYGRKMVLVKLAYVALFVFAGLYVRNAAETGAEKVLGMIAPPGFAFVGLALVSLLLINAQAVTSITTERDAKTLELLLVTDISAREFVFGKLGGILYNTRELLLLPLAGVCFFAWVGILSWENLAYVVIGLLTLVLFAAMLGLHSGLTYENSRTAIANSLGTMFFLFLGVFICIMLLVEARDSFAVQFPSFIVFFLGGSMGLWASLTHRNPSTALTASAFLLPFMTFYCITSFLLEGSLGVCVVLVCAYGFTTLAMLVPAVSAFDVALGRTSIDKGG